MNQPRMKKGEADDLPEADALAGAPHPRHVYSLVGHKRAEAEMLAAYREGRLAHAWLIGGRQGIGKATLAWRFARFVLANPDPAAKAVREARDLHVEPSHPAARLLAQLAHPDFALIRRDWRGTPKSKLRHPMPIAMTFLSGQGEEPVLIKVGTAYEAATHHRRPPPAFGPVRTAGSQ